MAGANQCAYPMNVDDVPLAGILWFSRMPLYPRAFAVSRHLVNFTRLSKSVSHFRRVLAVRGLLHSLRRTPAGFRLPLGGQS